MLLTNHVGKDPKIWETLHKIVDFPNFPETFWGKVMKRKSNVYGKNYSHILNFLSDF